MYTHTSDKTKAFEGIFVSILVIVIFVTSIAIFGLAERDVDLTPRSYTSFESLGIRPEDASLNLGEVPTDTAALKDFALMLYNLGGTNAKNAEALAAHCNCQMEMEVMNSLNYVDIDASIIKTQEEFFRIDYRLERDLPFAETLGSLAKLLDMVLTERFYTNTDMGYLAYQKVKNSAVDENDAPYAVWDNKKDKPKEEQREVPVYNSTQDGIFEVIAYTPNADAIRNVSVEYIEGEEGNYYKVALVFDPKNEILVSRVIDSIRKGSMDNNASYDKINYDFEIWDNGYFKSITISESWAAKTLGFRFSTKSLYDWSFSYDENDADPSAFKDCVDAKAMILGE